MVHLVKKILLPNWNKKHFFPHKARNWTTVPLDSLFSRFKYLPRTRFKVSSLLVRLNSLLTEAYLNTWSHKLIHRLFSLCDLFVYDKDAWREIQARDSKNKNQKKKKTTQDPVMINGFSLQDNNTMNFTPHTETANSALHNYWDPFVTMRLKNCTI